MNMPVIRFIELYEENRNTEDGELMEKMIRIEEWLKGNPVSKSYTKMQKLKQRTKEVSFCALLQRDTIEEMVDSYEKKVMINDLRKNLYEIMELEYKIENLQYLLSTRVFFNQDFSEIFMDTKTIFDNLTNIMEYRRVYS